jgi:4-hydroxy-3-polyprenylbenzoate decarboxylase
MATVYHPIGDVGASISSGSFQTMGMLILPCSIPHDERNRARHHQQSVVARSRCGFERAARLVLGLRETPAAHCGHLRTMVTLSDIGAHHRADRTGVSIRGPRLWTR